MKVAFIGKSHEFSLVPLKSLAERWTLVLVAEDAPRRPPPGLWKLARHVRRRLSGSSQLRLEARRFGAEYCYLSGIDVLRERMMATRPDIVAVASLTRILPESVLSEAPLGFINLHPSRLPMYHGPFPWFWQYHDFVLDSAVTVHQIDAGQDTGPIIEQVPMRIEMGMDIRVAMARAGEIGAEAMLRATESISSGVATLVPQDHGAHPKARVVDRSEAFIDWDAWSLQRVFHFLRGTYPWVDAVPGSSPSGRPPIRIVEGTTFGPPGTVSERLGSIFVNHPHGAIEYDRR